jgi:hypothetical protein
VAQFIYVLLFFVLGFTAHAEVLCADHDSTSVAVGLSHDVDKIVQSENKCDQYFKDNPDAAKFRAPDNAAARADDHYIGAKLGCLKGYGSGVSDQARGLGGFISSTWEKAKKQNELANDCDADETLQCKRRLADEIGWSALTDEKLKKISSAALLLRAQTIAIPKIQEQNEADRAVLAKNPDAFKQREDQLKADSLKKLDALTSAAQVFLQKSRIVLQCYSAEKQAELVCYGLSYILDPTIVVGGGLKGLRILAGLKDISEAKTAVTVATEVKAASAAPRVISHDVDEPFGEVVDLPPELRQAKAAPEKPAASHNEASVWGDHTGEKNNPYRDPMNQAQKKFLESIGVRFEGDKVIIDNPRQVAKNFNQAIKDKIAKGEVPRDGSLLMAEAYVGRDGKLIFSEIGQSPPLNAIPFDENKFIVIGRDSEGRSIYKEGDPTGLPDVEEVERSAQTDHRENTKFPQRADPVFTNADFLHGIKDGYTPIVISRKPVAFSDLSQDSPLFIHELGHAGGFHDDPKGMTAFKNTISKLFTQYGGVLPPKIDSKVFYVNEAALTVKPERISDLEKIIFNGKPKDIMGSFADQANGAVSRLSPEQLDQTAHQIMEWHQTARAPFGGALRTPTMARSVQARLDLIAAEIRTKEIFLKNDLLRKDKPVPRGKISSRILGPPSLIESSRRALQGAIQEYVAAAHDLSQTTIQGWFQAASQDHALPKGSPYYRYMCEGATVDTFKNQFCK